MTEEAFALDFFKPATGFSAAVEGNEEREIYYIQSIYGEDRFPYSTLYEMDDDEFVNLVRLAGRTERCGTF